MYIKLKNMTSNVELHFTQQRLEYKQFNTIIIII